MAICISDNIRVLRQKNEYTLEQLAGIIGVSRQTIAKWETGETLPDIINCGKLSALFKVTLDEFVTIRLSSSEALDTDEKSGKMMGVVSVDSEGRISIPEQVRELFDIQAGEKVLLLADEKRGIAIVKCSFYNQEV